LEKSAGTGMTVYPGGDANGKAPAYCKIEISDLSNPSRTDLPVWLTTYLHRDPTADISGSVRAVMVAAGIQAFLWNGFWNGVSTTLAYVATGTAVYEIAPSAIAVKANGTPVDADCARFLRTVLSNFQFLQ
jgi:hypothetical protein